MLIFFSTDHSKDISACLCSGKTLYVAAQINSLAPSLQRHRRRLLKAQPSMNQKMQETIVSLQNSIILPANNCLHICSSISSSLFRLQSTQ